MNRYIRNFLGNIDDVNGSFLLAKGERIVKISTTFLPSCNSCLAVGNDNSLTFGTSIINLGYITPPIIGINECNIVSTADVDNLVSFEFYFTTTQCDVGVCNPGAQLAFEIESDSLACPPPPECEIIQTYPVPFLVIGMFNDLTWTCGRCADNVLIKVENLTTVEEEYITGCEANGLPAVACADGLFTWTPLVPRYTVGDQIRITICCCSDPLCCGVMEFEIVSPA
jgi:hypothetical protein